MFRRGCVYWCQDNESGKQETLRTSDRAEALTLLQAKNEAFRQPYLNLQIARTYLTASDPQIAKRTWQAVMDEMTRMKTGSTLHRYTAAMKDKAFAFIRDLPILETQPRHFAKTLEMGRVATNVFLRRLQNFALGMNWLPWPILAKKQWPAVRYKDQRAITLEEHTKIVQREPNPETRTFYELLWYLGGSQSDIATLRSSDISWEEGLICYTRHKTGSVVQLHFGNGIAQFLRTLPKTGFLFPRMAEMHEKHRAKQFRRRCQGLGISGVSLHSYRYAWAERAKTCGYPERFAQQALGHNSKAVHRAYSRKAQVKLPALEDFERVHAAKALVPIDFQNGTLAKIDHQSA